MQSEIFQAFFDIS